MQCERLIKLVKTWYLHVKEETMAPARMVQFIKQHVSTCDTCKKDADIQDEIEKITDIILPESKIPKAVRLKQELDEAEVLDDEDEETEEETEEESENDDNDLEDDEFSDDEDPLAEEDDEDNF